MKIETAKTPEDAYELLFEIVNVSILLNREAFARFYKLEDKLKVFEAEDDNNCIAEVELCDFIALVNQYLADRKETDLYTIRGKDTLLCLLIALRQYTTDVGLLLTSENKMLRDLGKIKSDI